MTKKIVKRTDANNETLYFYTHSDAVDVGEGSSTKSLTEVLDDTLHKSAQTLTNAEKTQVHTNLGTESFVGDRAVRYDEAQVLGSSEKTQALVNLGLNGVDDVPTANSNNLVKSGGVEKRLNSVVLKGANAKYVYILRKLARGRRYSIIFLDTTWSTENTGETSLFHVQSINNSGSASSLVRYIKGDDLPQVINFTVPENSVSISIGGSADIDSEIQFYIIDDFPNASELKFNQIELNLQKGLYIPHNTIAYWDIVYFEAGILNNKGNVETGYSDYKTFTFDISDYIGKELVLMITCSASAFVISWPMFVVIDEEGEKTIHNVSGQPKPSYGFSITTYTPKEGDKYLKASARGEYGVVYLLCGFNFSSYDNRPIMVFPKTKGTLINSNSSEINVKTKNLFNNQSEDIEYGRYISSFKDGELIWTSNTNYAESDYIRVPDGVTSMYKTEFRTDGTINTAWGYVPVALFDKDKNPIRFVNNPNDYLRIRDGEKYFRFTFNYKNGSKYDVSPNANVDTYYPYQERDFTLKEYVENLEKHLESNIQEKYERLDLRIDDLNTRISEITGDGSQWAGKTWYAYGTSITSIVQGTYVPYLAEFSQMNVVNKGIAGGGIGDLGAYSRGQVRNAIMNITDGKLEADLITIEVGANDTGEDVPLGTIYDTDETTLCGCLNMCIRYLQENTNAQIVIMPSPATTTEPNAANKYYKAQWLFKQICFVNKCWWIDGMTNLGTAKITRTDIKYIKDNIHQTELGGYVFARAIWAELKRIPLFYTSIPA